MSNMNRIKSLISRLCPNGVEYKKLGEIGTFTRGSGIQKKDFVEDGKPCIHYGQVYTYYGLSASETKSFISDALYAGRRKANKDDLIIATTSENEEDVCKCVAWLGNEPCAVSGDAYIFSHEQDPKYLAYLFCSDKFQEQKKRYITGTKVLRVSGDDMAKIELPFPPLDIQHEIVRILDSFVELEAELEAELEVRRTQYAHYREQLLSRESLEEMAGGNLETMLLGEAEDMGLVKLGRGKVISKNAIAANPGVYPVYSASANNDGKMGSYGDWMFDDTRLTWSVDGGGKFFYRSNERYSVTNVCGWLKVLDEDKVNPRFLYYSLSSQWESIEFDYTRKAHPSVIRNLYRIPLVPLFVQQRVVDILDRFDALATSLVDGLPAEIEARSRQYEFYRDRLLDFPRRA